MLQINPIKDSIDSPKSATFEQPIDLLMSCHEKIIHFSSALYKIVSALKKEGWTDNYAVSVDQVRHYFNIAGPEHHLDEELHLFLAVIAIDTEQKTAQGREIQTKINHLIKEHDESDALWETLDKMLEERSEDFSALEKLARRFETDMHKHARIENKQIFPYAKANISNSVFKTMGLAIARRRGIKH